MRSTTCWTLQACLMVGRSLHQNTGAPRSAHKIREFMTGSVAPLSQCRLYLSPHSSIAFAAGYELDPKSGIQASLVQNTASGRSIWEFYRGAATDHANPWGVSEVNV